MNGNKIIKALAVSVSALMLAQTTAIGALAADISPEAVVYTRPEVVSADCNQVGVNYVYVDVVTENCHNDQTVMAYLTDANGNLVSVGYAPVGSNKAEIKIGAPDSAQTGTYNVAIALNKASEVFKSEVFYIGTGDVNGFFEAINMTDATSDAVLEKLNNHYNALSVIEYTKDDDGNIILKLSGKDYENLSPKAQETFAELILSGVNNQYSAGKGKYDAKNAERFVKEAYLLAAYNDGNMSDEKLAELLYRFDSVIGFDAEDENLYGKIENKDTLAKVVKTIKEKVETADELATAFEQAAAVQIVNETYWANRVTVVKNNNDLFGVDNDQVKKLLNSKTLKNLFCKEFNKTYYSVDEIKSAWDDAYEKAMDKYLESGNSGGGGNGGTVIAGGGNKENVVSGMVDRSENNKDKNVKVEDYYNDIGVYTWAGDAILNLTQNKIVSGYGDSTFRPALSVTRAEFMKMLVNVFGLADITATSSFTDVNANDWYYIYVASAEKCGIAQGYGNGLFGVNDPVSRQDAITMVYRAAQIKGLSIGKFSASTEVFKDRAEIAPYATEAVAALYNAGVYLDASEPTRVDTFEPTRNASRAYVTFVLNQLYMFINN